MDDDAMMESALFPWLDSASMADETMEPGAWDDEAELREMADTIRRLATRLGETVPPDLDSMEFEELDLILDDLYSRAE